MKAIPFPLRVGYPEEMAKTKVVEKEKALSFNEFLKLIGVG